MKNMISPNSGLVYQTLSTYKLTSCLHEKILDVHNNNINLEMLYH